MYNGIPVLYSKPATENVGIVGSTEGVEEWITPAGIGCVRDAPEEWMAAIAALDDSETYAAKRTEVIAHIKSMNIFTEAKRIAEMMEDFQRAYPIAAPAQTARTQEPTRTELRMPAALRPPPATARIGFSSGRLRLQR